VKEVKKGVEQEEALGGPLGKQIKGYIREENRTSGRTGPAEQENRGVGISTSKGTLVKHVTQTQEGTSQKSVNGFKESKCFSELTRNRRENKFLV